MTRVAVRLVIHGRVQGVGYRAWARAEAARLALDGWVRNRRGGAVELVAAGPPEAVDRLVDACRLGPTAASVTGLDRSEADDEGLVGFETRGTV